MVAPIKVPATPAPSTSAATPTPTLKLKIGGNLTPRATPSAPSNNAITPKAVIAVKPKGRKPKPEDTPSIPVVPVDDGSFDLLEEVIAIEKEKERLVASKKQRQSTAGSETVVPGKRKKDLLEELEEDEEILALASPSKKPSRSPQPSTEKDVRATSPAKFSGSIHVKRPSISVSEPAAIPEVKPPVESRQSPTKGKEKEVSSPAPTRLSAASETPMNKVKAREVLKNLLKLPEAAIFSRPVDPIQDGCPTYSFFTRPRVGSN